MATHVFVSTAPPSPRTALAISTLSPTWGPSATWRAPQWDNGIRYLVGVEAGRMIQQVLRLIFGRSLRAG
jgi:hypothetical protein